MATNRNASIVSARVIPFPILTAEWRYLVLVNWAVEPSLLLRHVPAGTELDSWGGRIWLSLVGFRFLETRVLGILVPWHGDFPEINLRFYVRRKAGGQRGVVFLREMVPRSAVALLARLLYREPYVIREMRSAAPAQPIEEPGVVAYAWKQRGRWNRFGVTAVGAPSLAAERSEEAALTEQSWGYNSAGGRRTLMYPVEHPRWRIWRVKDLVLDVDAAGEYGPELGAAISGPPASAFLAEGSPVRVGHPRLLPLP